MTRSELAQLYKAKDHVEKSLVLADRCISSAPMLAAPREIRKSLSSAHWVLKNLIDAAVIEHDAEDRHQSSLEHKGEKHDRRPV